MGRVKKIAAALIAACTLFGGAGVAYAGESGTPSDAATPQTASAGEPIYGKTTVSNVKVSDIGAHSANVSFNYAIDPSLLPQIKSVCFAADVQRILDVTPTAKPGGFGWGGYYDVSCQGVADEDMTQEDYDNIFGTHQKSITLGDDAVGETTYQQWVRYYNDSWDGKASGTFNMSLIGLAPNTAYGNRNLDQYNSSGLYPLDYNLLMIEAQLWDKGVRTKTTVDTSRMYVGMHIELKNGGVVPFDANAQKVQDFTTTAEPTSKPTQPDLTEANKGDLSTADGTVKAGSVARIYINNLAKECAAKVDAGESCFWYSYIYSDPVKLTGPDGAPYVTIAKDDAGKYYFDAYIPAGYSGAHKISLQDADGNIQGWTDVTVGEKTPEPTPSTADKAALNAAIAAAGKLNKADYTEATWSAFAKALDSAKAIAAKQTAAQTEVDAAAKALAAAQSGLKKAEAATPTPVTPTPDDQSKKDDQPKADKDKTQAESTKPAAKELPKGGAAVISVAAVMLVLAAAAGAAAVIRRRA